jgi:hypothetical protein
LMANDVVYATLPVVGAVMGIVSGAEIVKLLLELAVGKPLDVTRRRAPLVGGPVMVQGNWPLMPLVVTGAAEASVSYDAPPSRLSSMRTVSFAGRL